MYSYIKGTIVEMHKNNIVIENNGIGYLVYVPNPYTFTKGENTTVYIYQSVSENDVRLYGFKEAKQKDLFLMLIKVKGIGPKSATAILASGDVNEIIDAIENNNMKYLKSFPGIGPKAASQMVLDLKGKFDGVTRLEAISEDVSQDYEDAIEVLIALGYKDSDVNKAMKTLLHQKLDTNGYVKEALKILSFK